MRLVHHTPRYSDIDARENACLSHSSFKGKPIDFLADNSAGAQAAGERRQVVACISFCCMQLSKKTRVRLKLKARRLHYLRLVAKPSGSPSGRPGLCYFQKEIERRVISTFLPELHDAALCPLEHAAVARRHVVAA